MRLEGVRIGQVLRRKKELHSLKSEKMLAEVFKFAGVPHHKEGAFH